MLGLCTITASKQEYLLMLRLGTLAVFAAILHKVLEKKKPGPQLSRVGFSEAKLVHGGIAGQAHHESK